MMPAFQIPLVYDAGEIVSSVVRLFSSRSVVVWGQVVSDVFDKRVICWRRNMALHGAVVRRECEILDLRRCSRCVTDFICAGWLSCRIEAARLPSLFARILYSKSEKGSTSPGW